MYHFFQKGIFWEGGPVSQLKCSILILFPQTFSQYINNNNASCLLSVLKCPHSFFI